MLRRIAVTIGLLVLMGLAAFGTFTVFNNQSEPPASPPPPREELAPPPWDPETGCIGYEDCLDDKLYKNDILYYDVDAEPESNARTAEFPPENPTPPPSCPKACVELEPKDPRQDPSAQGNAALGGGQNANSGPGTYVPPSQVELPPSYPRVNPEPPSVFDAINLKWLSLVLTLAGLSLAITSFSLAVVGRAPTKPRQHPKKLTWLSTEDYPRFSSRPSQQ